MFKEINTYYQKLLNAQYDVAEIIDHLLTRGEVREDFLKDIIKKRKDSLKIEKGILCDHQGQQSPQCDVLIAKSGIAVERLGTHCVMQVSDCNIVLEIKSNATTRDLKECEEKAARINNLESATFPTYGLFCYKYDLKKNNLLRRFGYRYEKETQEFYKDETEPLKYPHIDFVLAISIEEEETEGDPVLKQMFLMKNKETNTYDLYLDYPAIRHFWRLIDGL